MSGIGVPFCNASFTILNRFPFQSILGICVAFLYAISFISMDGEYFQAYHNIDKKRYEITYVLSGWGIKENYVVFGIKEVEKGGKE